MNTKFYFKLILKSFMWLLLICFFFATSCQKDDFDPEDENNPDITLVKVSELEIPDVHPDKSTVIRVISLKNLIESCKKNPQSQDVYDMYGLQRIEGYIVDNENSDILIYGREVKNWPKTPIFDFIESLRNVTDSVYMPYCSLDPSVKGIKALDDYFTTVDLEKFDPKYAQQVYGKQQCIVGGVAKKSNFAAVMISADYHMKKVSQGLEKLDSVKSTWDLLKEDNYKSSMGMSRFWFNIEDKYPVYTESGSLFRIKELPIHVSTMAQEIDSKGNLVDVPSKDPLSIKFAEGFTKQFNNFSLKNETYSKLANLYYLQALTEAMRYNGLLTKTNPIFQYFRKDYPVKQTVDFPDALESVISFTKVTKETQTTIETFYFILSGGVDVGPQLSKDNIIRNSSGDVNVKPIEIIYDTEIKDTDEVDFLIDWKNQKYRVQIYFGIKPGIKTIKPESCSDWCLAA